MKNFFKSEVRNDTGYPKIGKNLSFPNALIGNPHEVSIRCPTKTFGHDNFGIGSKAQTVLEYLILIGIVTVVLFAMYQAMKRGVQSVIKIAADQIGNQQNADQVAPNTANTVIINGIEGRTIATSGYLVESYTATRANSQKETRELQGDIGYFYDEKVSTYSNALTNLGFSPRGGN